MVSKHSKRYLLARVYCDAMDTERIPPGLWVGRFLGLKTECETKEAMGMSRTVPIAAGTFLPGAIVFPPPSIVRPLSFHRMDIIISPRMFSLIATATATAMPSG